MAAPNRHESRELWLRAATKELRPYFESVGYPLPELIRFSIAFTSSGRKGVQPGETWHGSTTEDDHFEIIIKADQWDPVEILGVLVHQLVHAVLPVDAGHGKLYKAAAVKVGLQGQMRHAMPGPLLRKRLEEVAASLGPLPHAKLDIERHPMDRGIPADRPKKQGTRLLKAECNSLGCGYTVRITSKWVRELGAPHCPKHGEMNVDLPRDEEEVPAEVEELAEAV